MFVRLLCSLSMMLGASLGCHTALGEDDLETALDSSGLVWTTGGDANWVLQSTTTYDGIDAASNLPLARSQASWIETTVTGPGILSYWKKQDGTDVYGSIPNSSFPYNVTSHDYFKVYVNEIHIFPSSPASNYGLEWSQYIIQFPSGMHKMRWNFYQYPIDPKYISSSSHHVWLDKVLWQPDINMAAWYNTHFSVLEQSNASVTGLDADPDGDKSTNLQEYQNGTNPKDTLSVKETRKNS